MMSQVGHNVHNVTPRLLIIVEKAQFIDIVHLLCNLGIMWDVHYHSYLGEDIYAFHTVRLCDCLYAFFFRILHDHLPNTGRPTDRQTDKENCSFI